MLPAPNLDDRRFQQLVDEAKRMVQRTCPEWTDHNVSDPGVTLIEAFAFMTDQLMYRLNRVPERVYVKFMDLIGLRMVPASPARAPVTFWLSTPPATAFSLSQGTEIVATASLSSGAPVVFSTAERLSIVPCAVAALATHPAEEDVAVDRTENWELESPVSAFSTVPVVDDALYVGLDVPVPNCAVRIDLVAQAQGVGVNPKRPPLVWEAWCDREWVECEVGEDQTGGINRSGAIVLHVPKGHETSVVAERAAGWLRARVNEPDPGQPPYTSSPVIESLSACTVGGTVAAVNATVVDEETLGESEGVAGQRFALLRWPVVSSGQEPVLEVSSDAGWTQWKRVEHFAESDADDAHYVLDYVAGEVVFGPIVRLPDGSTRQYGAVPVSGATVRIRGYVVGGGPAGNIAAGALTSLGSSIPFVTSVENRQPATGGTAGETLEEAMRRAPLLLRTRERAVTAEDYEALSIAAAPEVARVRCVAADGESVSAGSVKVLVVPAAPMVDGRVALEDLIPQEASLRRIAERLDKCRVAGVQVLLEPPRYRGITVVARLVAHPRAVADDIRSEALRVLYELLCPLPGGGPAGEGWPFGQAVQPGALYAALQRVRGVNVVDDLRMFAADPVTGKRGSPITKLDVDKHSLVFSFEHQVLVEEG